MVPAMQVVSFYLLLYVQLGYSSSLAGASQRHSSVAGSSRLWWPFEDGLQFTEHGDDLAPPVAQGEANVMVSSPGEGPILDEIVPVPLPRLRSRSHRASLATFTSANVVRPMVPEVAGATPVSNVADRFESSVTIMSASSPAAKLNSHAPIIDEYDVDDGDQAVESHGDTMDHEKMTEEDFKRQKTGDINHFARPVKGVHGIHHHLQARQVTSYNDRLRSDIQAEAIGSSHRVTQLTQAQCLAFANHMKTQGIKGVELVRVWKGTCDPAVMAGAGGQQYSMMCSSLGSAVGQFAGQVNWDANQVCMAVLQVFHESGVGAVPSQR